MSINNLISNVADFAACLSKDGTSLAERTSYALQTSITGILIVFGALAILWGVLEISRIVFYEIPKKKADKQSNPAPVVSEAEVIEESETAESNEEEIVAAITAAVAVYLESDDENYSQSGFRVVSFRRVSGQKAWNKNR